MDAFDTVCCHVIHHRVLLHLTAKSSVKTSSETGSWTSLPDSHQPVLNLPIRSNSCQVFAKRLCNITGLEQYLTRLYPVGVAPDKWLTEDQLKNLQSCLIQQDPSEPLESDAVGEEAATSSSSSGAASLLSYYCSSSSSTTSCSAESLSSTADAAAAAAVAATIQETASQVEPTFTQSSRNPSDASFMRPPNIGRVATKVPAGATERAKRRFKRCRNFTVRAPDCYDRVCHRVIQHRLMQSRSKQLRSSHGRKIHLTELTDTSISQPYRSTVAVAIAKRSVPSSESQVLVRHFPIGVSKDQWMSELEFEQLKLLEAKKSVPI